MELKGIFLSWIVVKNLEDSLQFYTKILGLKIKIHDQKNGWAELIGPEGTTLGISQENSQFTIKAGTNAVITLTVEDLESARLELLNKGAQVIGHIIELPGDARLQTFKDLDGNMLQLVEIVKKFNN